ncbi:MAG: four helix bundle protein [Elusimicrobia bacterium]|nr:four helix bundle protein [Elusimicrobiota bacterium]
MIAYQKAFNLAKEVYLITEKFPKEERFGIVQQIQRAAVSVVSNIAEGAARNSGREKLQFFIIARGSLVELETQLQLSLELKFFQETYIFDRIGDVSRLLYGLIRNRRERL